MLRAALGRPRGRHAKPSAAAPALVAGGLTAALAVGELATAGAASAASGDDFARLAQCESGGNPATNTGNGFYGMYQFDRGTWQGLGYSGVASDASASVQTQAAARLQAQRGWGPWPSCSARLGLGRGGSSGGGAVQVAAAPQQAAPRQASPSVADSATRASRYRRTVAPAVVPITGEYQASDRARVVIALATTTAPVFDGHVLSAATDSSTYRIAAKHWQRRMAARGWDVAVDGYFGPQSAAVAQAFAADKGLSAPVGTVNRAVWDAAWATPVS